jgi:hypothetical protein
LPTIELLTAQVNFGSFNAIPTVCSVYDPTVTEWDLYYWFVEERPYPEDLIKDDELTADYAHEKIDGVREMMEMIIEHSKNKKRDIIVQPQFNKAFV